MTGKEHLQELFNSENIERIAKFLKDISTDCDECRIKDFCDRCPLGYKCEDVWQDWLTSECEEE